MKKLFLGTLFSVSILFAAADERPALPNVSPDAMKVKSNFKCKVPDWLVHLPPAVEVDYKECANTRSQPTDKLAETVLKQQVSKKAKLLKVEPALEFYSRVYRVSYKIEGKKHTMLCNDSMEYCTAEAPLVTRKR